MPDHRAVYLAVELCGCFIGIEEHATDVVRLWRSWRPAILLQRIERSAAEEAQAALFCETHARRAA